MALPEIKTTGNCENIKIDDVEYSLTDFDDFSPIDQINAKRQYKRISNIFESDKSVPLVESEIKDLDYLENELFEKVAGNIPDDVRKKIRSGQRIQIINAYFTAYAGSLGLKKEDGEKSQSGPEVFSPDSSDFMGEPLKSG